MFNMWKTSQNKGSFCKILLKSFLILTFISLISCDGARARLSSLEVKTDSQFWVWNGTSFTTIASEEGLKRKWEEIKTFRIPLETPVLWSSLDKKIYWTADKEGLFYFPSHSPHLIKREKSHLVNYFYSNKIANNLIKVRDGLILFFSYLPNEEKEGEVFQGLNALFIGKAGSVDPFFFPFFKGHICASLLDLRVPSPNHLLTKWRENEDIFYLDLNLFSHQEKTISSKEYKNSFTILPSYSLRAPFQEILNRIASQESIGSFLVEVFNESEDYTYFLEKGVLGSAEKTFKAYETSHHLSVLSQNRIYHLNKNSLQVKTIELPTLGESLYYEKVIPSEQGFWISWYVISPLDSHEKIVGLLRVPYVR